MKNISYAIMTASMYLSGRDDLYNFKGLGPSLNQGKFYDRFTTHKHSVKRKKNKRRNK
jgi:hypothetical protein